MVKIGHRGAMGYEPENTLRSIEKALEQNVDMVEFDVQALKDGEIILMHDDTLDRTTNGHGFVAEKTLKEIKQLDAGKGEKVPTLQEALDVIDKKVPVIIEMTGFLTTASLVSDIISYNVKKNNWKYEDIMVSSFIHPELLLFREYLPQVKIGANISAIPVSYARFAQEIGVDFVATENLYLKDDKFVKDAQARGLEMYLYSVDDPYYLQRYEKFGIDGVFSNKPDKII